MTNPSKQKGTKWESDVVAYLRASGWPQAERRALHGSLDKGDIAGVPETVLECKAERAITLSTYIEELLVEKENANAKYGAVIVKRRYASVSDSYAVMTTAMFLELLYAALVK